MEFSRSSWASRGDDIWRFFPELAPAEGGGGGGVGMGVGRSEEADSCAEPPCTWPMMSSNMTSPSALVSPGKHNLLMGPLRVGGKLQGGRRGNAPESGLSAGGNREAPQTHTEMLNIMNVIPTMAAPPGQALAFQGGPDTRASSATFLWCFEPACLTFDLSFCSSISEKTLQHFYNCNKYNK